MSFICVEREWQKRIKIYLHVYSLSVLSLSFSLFNYSIENTLNYDVTQ